MATPLPSPERVPTRANFVPAASSICGRRRHVPHCRNASERTSHWQALAISGRGYILDQGKVVLSGGAAELLADDRMAKLYRAKR